MKLKYTPTIANDVVSIVINIDSLGTATVTSTDEQTMLSDFISYIEYKDLTFSRKLNLDTNNDVIEDTANGETVTLNLVNKKILLDANFTTSFSISTDDISNSALQTIFNTKDKLARAYATVFKLTIRDAVANTLTAMRAKLSDFEIVTTEIV
jgi:hypothetical protein